MRSLKALVALLSFAAPALLTSCGTCTPAGAYTIPAYTDPAHYEYNTVLDHWRTEWSCTHYYTNSYGRYGYHYRPYCTSSDVPVYRTEKNYVGPVYHPSQYVPAVTCKQSGQ